MNHASSAKIPTSAMRKWCRRITRAGGEVKRFYGPTYDMAGRMRDAGLVEIINEPGAIGWPYTGWSLRLTDAGRTLAEAQP